MRAGKLRHRVVIQEKVVARDGYGEEDVTWSEVDTVWGSVEPLRGREYLEGRQEQADVSHRIRMRYQGSITPTMRVLYPQKGVGSRVFEVLSVLNPVERDISLELMCREAVDD